MKKILLPVDLPNVSLGVVHQAAFLARHFSAEIILLHVVTPLSYPAGILEKGHKLTERDLHAEAIVQAEKQMEQSLGPELDGIAVRRLLLRGEPAREIVESARDEKVDLIVMSTNGFGAVYRLLLGSVTAKVLHEADCPMWIGAHQEKSPDPAFAIRSVLCAIDLSHHSRNTVSRAAELAAEFGANLTLVHITTSVEIFGPGGLHVIPELKKELVDYAEQEIAKIQKDARTRAGVIIESGNAHKLLNEVAKRINADLLVVGHLPAGGHLGANGSGYSIIRESHIPVLSI